MSEGRAQAPGAVAITVGVPCYNVAPYLEQCIRSLLAQTFDDFEIVAVDDGSTDETPAILDELAREDGRLRVIRQDNKGLGPARNRVLDEARGAWITFVDGDDWLAPDCLAAVHARADRDGLDILCFGWVRLDRPGGRAVQTRHDHVKLRFDRPAELRQKAFSGRLNLMACASLVRTRLFRGHGLRYPKALHEDLYVTPFLHFYAERHGYLDSELYFWRDRTGSITERPVGRDHIDGMVGAFHSWKERLSAEGRFDAFRASFILGVLSYMSSLLRRIEAAESVCAALRAHLTHEARAFPEVRGYERFLPADKVRYYAKAIEIVEDAREAPPPQPKALGMRDLAQRRPRAFVLRWLASPTAAALAAALASVFAAAAGAPGGPWLAVAGAALVGFVVLKESAAWRWMRERDREAERARARRELRKALRAERRAAKQALTQAVAAERRRARPELTTLLRAERSGARRALAQAVAEERSRADQALAEAVGQERERAGQALTQALAEERARAGKELEQAVAEERSRAGQALAEAVGQERERAGQALTQALAEERARAGQALSKALGKVDITVGVPCYNVAPYLEKCIRSLLDQTFDSFEIIAVNDGSTDRTAEILDDLARESGKLRVIYQDNCGAGGDRNRVLEEARGEYVTFVDGDDWLAPDCLAAAYARALRDDLDILCFGWVRVDAAAARVVETRSDYVKLRFDRPGEIRQQAFSGQLNLMACASLVRTRLFHDHGLRYPAALHDDLYVTPFLHLYAERHGYLDGAFYFWRKRAGSTTERPLGEDHIDGVIGAVRSWKRRLSDEGRFADFRASFVLGVIAYISQLLRRIEAADIDRAALRAYLTHALRAVPEVRRYKRYLPDKKIRYYAKAIEIIDGGRKAPPPAPPKKARRAPRRTRR